MAIVAQHACRAASPEAPGTCPTPAALLPPFAGHVAVPAVPTAGPTGAALLTLERLHLLSSGTIPLLCRVGAWAKMTIVTPLKPRARAVHSPWLFVEEIQVANFFQQARRLLDLLHCVHQHADSSALRYSTKESRHYVND
ncbi:hypothetical protein NDU88_002267 [Pleurodeles waltl]|uniref:Uncharacterized protein n=1 Tax=Pleurodeles waltl TaxID=8319 RepID=A0AAV7UAL0_PLEWA|nr:hypothetical protein NDU88_002267 [Pleurodeles waltl]